MALLIPPNGKRLADSNHFSIEAAMRAYFKFLVGGQRIDPVELRALDVINPADETMCGRIAIGAAADVDKAVAAARAAFPG